LALHAGDVFVGSFEFNTYLGYPELKIMEGLYDAMSLGNHFSEGPQVRPPAAPPFDRLGGVDYNHPGSLYHGQDPYYR